MEENNDQCIRVAIVDDHTMIADSIAQLLDDGNLVRITGKAYSVAACRALLQKEQPDVLLLDIGLRDGNGIDLCIEIKSRYPTLKILMLTSYDEIATIRRALDSGADGYVLKNATPDELLEGICTVASGERFLCDAVHTVLNKNQSNTLEITPRELQLLKLIVEGFTLPQQADKMCLGTNTIRFYRQKLNLKLDVHNTVQLVQRAKELGLV